MSRSIFFLAVSIVLIGLVPISLCLEQDLGDMKTPVLNPELENLKLLYPDSTFKYRGVISANMASDDVAHELLVDFGSQGLWWLGGKTAPWVKITSDNPASMMPIEIDGDPAIEVVLDFETKGLWLFDYTTQVNWIRLTGDNPENMVAADDDNDGIQELVVDFASKGLWHYDFTYGWGKRTNESPAYGGRMDVWDPGHEETVWKFYGKGVWNVYGTLGHVWNQLTGDEMYDDYVSAELGIGDAAEEFVADFGTKGLWGYNGSIWTLLSRDNCLDIRAVRFVGLPDYELLVVFNFPAVNGLWLWQNSCGLFPGQWHKLTNDNPAYDEAFCEPFDPDGTTETSGDEEVAVDFSAKGLWLYNHTTGFWLKLTNDSPRFMVRSDLDGDGVDNYLICDFDAKGLWYYSGKTGLWTRLTGDSPDPNSP